MASTYTTSLKIQEITTGEQAGTWGTTTNTNWTLIEQAVAGVQAITMSNANYTLTNTDGTLDEARNMVLAVGGTNSGIYKVITPLVSKFYVVSNQTAGGYAITIGASTGAAVTIPNGASMMVYCDGVDFYTALTNITSGTVSSSTITGGTLAGSITSTATVSGGTYSGATISTPTVSGATISSSAITGSSVGQRTAVVADGNTFAVNCDTTDIATQANTQVAGTLTVSAPTGTPTNGQKLIFRVTSTNSQTYAWNSIYAASTDLALPTATTGSSKTDYVGFIYNSTAVKWQMVAKISGF